MPLKIYEVTHQELEAAFRLKGISKRNVAEKLGVHDSYINKIINGSVKAPALEAIHKANLEI